MKILYFDTETTGLSSYKNDVIQIAGIIEIDGDVKEEFNYFCQPYDMTSVSEEALKVNNLTLEIISTFSAPKEMYNKLNKLFSKYVDKYDKTDKFIAAGQNVKFDLDFLKQFFVKSGDKYFNSFFDYHYIDLMCLSGYLNMIGAIKTENLKLVTIANYFGIKFNAHEALADIRVTRELLLKIKSFIRIEEGTKVE